MYPHSPNPPSEKGPSPHTHTSPPLQFGQVENSHEHSFKRRVYFVLKVIGYPLSSQAEC